VVVATGQGGRGVDTLAPWPVLIRREPPSDWENTVSYRVHRFELKMTKDEKRLEDFLNGLTGEVVSVVPNVSWWFVWAHRVDFVLIVEKLP
jgi:hypothetical protein